VRHKRDWGAVILCDSRFASKKQQDNISVWARPYIVDCQNYANVSQSITTQYTGRLISVCVSLQLKSNCVSAA
jgi:regulator of telomere elongation helicase 1